MTHPSNINNITILPDHTQSCTMSQTHWNIPKSFLSKNICSTERCILLTYECFSSRTNRFTSRVKNGVPNDEHTSRRQRSTASQTDLRGKREETTKRQLPAFLWKRASLPDNIISFLPFLHHLPLSPSTRPPSYRYGKIKLNVHLISFVSYRICPILIFIVFFMHEIVV